MGGSGPRWVVCLRCRSVGGFGKLGAAPRTIGDSDASSACFIADHQHVLVRLFPVVQQTVGTVVSVGMHVARVRDIVAHHLTAVLGHAAVSHERQMCAMGR